MTVGVILIAMIVATVFGVIAIGDIGHRSAEQILRLLCQTGEKNLDHYFESVEQSVEMVSAYVASDLSGLDDASLQAHLDRVSGIFSRLTHKTSGILTYYYRIDPSVSDTVKGFWYVDLDGEGFRAHEVTDITLYDTSDTGALVWFTVPKDTGHAIWLPPYLTDNLDVLVISYNTPVYYEGQFVGVIGIEIDYSTMANVVDHITLYENGYAFVSEDDGTVVYHPRVDVTALDAPLRLPQSRSAGEGLYRYRYDGMEKLGASLPLENGMRLNVTVPVDEMYASSRNWSFEIVMIFLLMLLVFLYFILHFTEHITKPIRELAEVAEQVEAGNYDNELHYNGRDEVGTLTRAFRSLSVNLKATIRNLSDLAYADALTSLRNKGAFDIYMENIQQSLSDPERAQPFAVCIFDCNNLKTVNDRCGHDKGDLSLQQAAAIICEVFDHSPVFRIGGDEFAAVLTGHDYEHRDELTQLFAHQCAAKREQEREAWDQVDVAYGLAVYDPAEDESANAVVRRADKTMYECKWRSKHGEVA